MIRKKILHIQKTKGISGSEKHLHQLLVNLDPKKYDLHYIILEESDLPQEAYASLFKGSSLHVERWPIKRHFDFSLIRKLKHFIKKEKFDLVHTHLIHADIHGAIAAHRAGIRKIVSTKHDRYDYHKINYFQKIPLHYATRYLTRVITISEALKEYYIFHKLIPEEKMETIHYGIERGTNIEEKNPEVEFLFLGRLLVDKGCRELLSAFEEVFRTFHGAKLWIVGDGPLKGEMMEWVKERKFEKSIEFLGYRKDINNLIDRSAIMVVPSYVEGFGLVLLEGMSRKKPLIATKVSAIPEIVINEKTGLLVPPRDASSLARAMISLLKNEELRKKMGVAGYERLKTDFSLEKMVARTEAFYDRLFQSQ